ncbi:enoyl-CoA hydratase/isomerase family protein [Aurantiacibacter poecillastricola]|uniref:enoyl-CoA hydratase/isomerase family protein n=1 Tax=Aurantiacibacter poecillastricola TaxID=3064385 RepID=UPI00273E1E90|nr:enoyl-CoA hydratase/isomerase family protein [Aurantiacibacter sp. 219JJ12-13]MDP5263157.1 enoyl-CoA hydratase/isomerase family protein [Aurantiacibacter sp. 219JJ12-13]
MTDQLNIHAHGQVGHLSLNRPKAIHALTLDMCEGLSAALLEWRGEAAIEAVILDHAEGRGFCAGGDVALLRNSAMEDGGAKGREFFHAEYRLNHLMFTYPKPIIAFMDGVTMGGGVGISQPAKFRVATENTKFAMPEGSIGLFPDVGAGHYLPRLPGQVGKFLALTGARLDGAECLWAGLATHYIANAKLAEVKARIVAEPGKIQAILDEFSSEAPEPRIAGNKGRIDKLFAPETLEGIIANLEQDASDWAAKELAAVSSKCPMTSKVALHQFSENADCRDFAANMAMEYRIAARMIMRPDFAEGVRAVLVDKDNAPQWQPAEPEQISEGDVEAIFAPLPEGEEWTPFPASA